MGEYSAEANRPKHVDMTAEELLKTFERLYCTHITVKLRIWQYVD